MSDAGSSWVFAPLTAMDAGQQQRWREHCFKESAVDALLHDPLRSVVISCVGGCGISTSLALLQQSNLLVFSYNPDQWPGQSEHFTTHASHFAQWMAWIADLVLQHLSANQAQLHHLNAYQHQFLIWLIERYLKPRQSRLWYSQIQPQLQAEVAQMLAKISGEEPIDYGDSVADVKYQIHECLDLVRSLGWQGIFATVDVNWWDWFERSLEARVRLEQQLRDLLTTLAPLEVPGFGVKLGLASHILPPQEVDRLTRGRIKPLIYPAVYQWTLPQLQQICADLVALACEEAALPPMPPPGELWDWLQADLVSIWERPGPAAAHALALIWMGRAGQGLEGEALHLALRADLFRTAAPLRRDPRPAGQVVYRGQLAIQLDEMPWRILDMLWQYRGNPASNEALLQIAGTKANLDKLISRLREQLEPLYRSGTMLYVQRRPHGGTWLEQSLTHF